jgi:hypothetical protein
LETSLAEVVEVLLVKVSSADEGENVGAVLDVGEDQLSWVRKTSTVDAVITRIGIKVISVVVPLVVAQLDNIVSLDDPDKLLDGVIQVQLHLYVGIDGRFVAGKLKLLNQILVRSLCESSSLIGIQVDVVNEKSSILNRRDAESIKSSIDANTAAVKRAGGGDVALSLGSELKLDLDLVILEGNKGKRQTRVSAKPELEWDVQGGGLSTLETSSSKGDGVSNHVIITGFKTRGDGELVPDGEPIAILFVNSLTSDLDFNRLDEEVANEIDPSEESGRDGSLNTGKSDL